MTLVLKGTPAAPGIAIGDAVLWNRRHGDAGTARIRKTCAEEMDRLTAAIQKTTQQLNEITKQLSSRVGDQQADVLRAQLHMLDDPIFRNQINDHIQKDQVSAEEAVERAIQLLVKKFRALQDNYLRERAVDIEDVGERLQSNLAGLQPDEPVLDSGIIFANNLTPSEISLFDPEKISGIVTEKGGKTAHTTILAQALNIPVVVGVPEVLSRVRAGDIVVVDGTEGEVIVHPNEERMESYRRRVDAERTLRMATNNDLPAITLDGFRVQVGANIASHKEIGEALSLGADSIGLFRSEFLFLNRDVAPSEDEQFEIYKVVVSQMAPRPVVIRTLDAGGDKPITIRSLPLEPNPALGMRGIRLSLAWEDLFCTQLRALFRAAKFGDLRIMLPMVSDLSEVRRTREIIRRIGASSEVHLGIMVETPAAAVMAEELAEDVSFFSVGTNDLAQYVLAVDRMNEQVGYLYQPLHPAVLRLIRQVNETAMRKGIQLNICGQLAGDPLAVLLFVGMGVSELSMQAPLIPRIKTLVRKLKQKELAALAEEVLKLKAADEVQGRLREFAVERAGLNVL
jgi:phosphoenolpyruvate-protein phosphotransferase (PTS system enzyme I)